MKIAISTDGEYVSSHFGRCPSFTIVEIENDAVVNEELFDNPGHHPGFLPQFFAEKGINYVIAGGAGHRAQGLFAERNIQLILGISGKVNETIDKLLKGELKGGESLCRPGAGKGYGLDKTECDHGENDH